jgi:2-hydroxymethylglutarate dehydrogenase
VRYNAATISEVTEMAQSPIVGFIGLGLMGKPMARNVLKSGFSLVVHNRSRGKVDELSAEGAVAATSPADLASRCDIIVSCLPGPADVELVYLGENGVVAAAKAGSVIVEMSTIDPETHQRIAEVAAKRGVEYLDAPVSGGTTGARDGTLSIMVGGSPNTLEKTRSVLSAMGKNIYHVGEQVGAGAVAKLVNNMMNSINALGVSEGLVIGAKWGIDPQLLVDIVSNSSGSSRTLIGAAPNILRRYFEPGFAIDLMHKDVSLACALGEKIGVPLRAGPLARQVLQEARDAGLGDRSTQAQILPLEQKAGVEVKGSSPSEQ